MSKKPNQKRKTQSVLLEKIFFGENLKKVRSWFSKGTTGKIIQNENGDMVILTEAEQFARCLYIPRSNGAENLAQHIKSGFVVVRKNHEGRDEMRQTKRPNSETKKLA